MASPINRRGLLKLLWAGFTLAACRLFNINPGTLAAPPSASPSKAALITTEPGQTGVLPTQAPTTNSLEFETTQTNPTASQAATEATLSQADFPYLIIDAHQDIAWNALEFGRDPLDSAALVRDREAANGIDRLIGQRTTGLPEYLAGRVGIVIASIFVMPAALAYPGYSSMTYTTAKQAGARAWEQLRYYQNLTKPGSGFVLIKSLLELNKVITQWAHPLPNVKPNVGLLISMEGADPIASPEELGDWYEAGVRAVGPAWRRTRYSGGTGEPGPLTDLGRKLLSEMSQKNMILDLSHISERAFLEAVEIYSGTIIASHSNPRQFLPTDRGLSNEMIHKLVERDGVIGVVLYNRYLKPGWKRGDARSQVTLETVMQVIDAIVQLAGDSHHVALGTDFDGGFGLDSIPFPMDSIADLLDLVDVLRNWGYTDADMDRIFNYNWLRILQQGLT